MITLDNYLNYWKVHYGYVKVDPAELTDEMKVKAKDLISKVNVLLGQFGESRAITSGWRPVMVNKVIPGAAIMSNHTKCQAVDLYDPDGSLDTWCMNNLDKLAQIGLWLEHPSATKNWCHLQSVPPRSNVRVFYP